MKQNDFGKEDGKISISNSTTSPLGNGETFTGSYEEIYMYASITVIINTDQIGTLYVDFSTDSVSADRTIQLSDGTSIPDVIHSLIPVSRYFRVRLVNSSTPQTTLAIQTIFHTSSKIAQPTSRATSTISDYSDTLNTRSVIVAKAPDGTYNNIKENEQGELLVSNGVKDVFGQTITATYNTRNQNYHQYGIVQHNQLIETFSASGGTLTDDSGYAAQLDITNAVGSYIVLRSKRSVKYQAGYSITARNTALFDTPVATSIQFCGLGNAQSDAYFLYNGTDFGVRYSTDGQLEVRKLTLSAAASGVEDIDIVLNGTTFNILLSNASSDISFSGHEVEIGGTGSTTYTGWSVEHVGNDVFFIAGSVGARSGTYSFTNNTGGGTAAASFSQIKAGVALTSTFVAQSAWNGASTLKDDLVHTDLNIYEIQMSWYGVANIRFSIYNSSTSRFETVHTFSFTQTTPSVSSPNMFNQIGLSSLGSTTAMTMKSTGHFAATTGEFNIFRNPKYGIATSKSLSSNTEAVVIVLKPRLQINGYSNQSEAVLTFISASADGNRPVTVKLIKNPTSISADSTSDYTSYQYEDETNSIIVYDTTADTYSGGNQLLDFIIPKNGGTTIDVSRDDFFINRNDTIIITAESSAANTFDLSLSWLELY